ncbi:FkbM family methyltransferase [Yinghuangia seranimata]|uniref:FkbM family methyltransferase n=1 Tax=Yinghuangia seranimata TaxID=408067 RepID=UPI00248CF880|nr:FkbM family methyltransferase [Yinghuangia seranimata]MDI2128790.1 FkbM family methyltransferase [Yinghuangia seranimata]
MAQPNDPSTSVASGRASGSSAASRATVRTGDASSSGASVLEDPGAGILVPAQTASRSSHERIRETRYRRHATNLRLWSRNRDWWQADLPVGTRLRYYGDMAASYVRVARGQRRGIRYLDRTFMFDDVAAPLNLQAYPRAVGRDVLGNLRPGSTPRSVLDVGGNLGQFAVTLRHFAPHAQIDVFEPNSAVVPLLEQNTAGLEGVRVWPYALSPRPVDELYVEPGRSASGSLLADQVDAIAAPRSVAVRSVSDPSSVTGHQEYDLVRIDVAGYELEVLKCLGGMTVHYLYLEMSGLRGVYPHSELLMLVRRQFGDFRIVFQGPCDRRSVNHPVLLEFAG